MWACLMHADLATATGLKGNLTIVANRNTVPCIGHQKGGGMIPIAQTKKTMYARNKEHF